MLTLTAFGALELRDGTGRPLSTVLAQTKRAALLTYLTLARPGSLHRRDALLAVFWPELDQARGRNALSQALSFLRRELGEGVLVTRGPEEVGVDLEAIRCDVLAFLAAVEGGRWADAMEAYRGELLEGLHVAGAAPFSDWVDRERTRLREAAAMAAWALAHQRIGAGELVEAERTAQQALHLVPTDESPVRGFVEALARAGDRGAALRFYETFTGVLARELEVEPAPETTAVAEAVRRGEIGAERRADEGRILHATTSSPATAGPGREAVYAAGRQTHRRPKRRWKVLVPAVGLAAALGGIGYASLVDSRVAAPGTLLAEGLDPYPRVVVADFDFPADPELGHRLAFCLTVALDQSDLIRPLGPAERGAALRRMMRDPSLPLDGETAHEIAVRDGHSLVLVPELGRTESGYIVTARLEAADTRELLGQFRAWAGSDEELFFTAQDRLAADVRERVGDSRRSIRRSLPLEQVTTPSLEALRLYTEAERLHDLEGRIREATPLLEKAIARDSSFAMAYRKLAVALGNLGASLHRLPELRQLAWEHRDRLTDFERLSVEVSHNYDASGPGASECQRYGPGLQAYEAYVHLHPRDQRPLLVYGFYLARVGRREDAVEVYRRALSMGAATNSVYNNLFFAYLDGDETVRAREILAEWRTTIPENPSILTAEAALAYRRGSYSWVDSLFRVWGDRFPDDPGAATHQANLDALRGRLAEAREHRLAAQELHRRRGDEGNAELLDTHRGLVALVALQDTGSALAAAQEMLGADPGEDRYDVALIDLGLLFAFAGDLPRARAALDTLGAHGAGNWSEVAGPLQAAIAMAEGDPEVALDHLDAAGHGCSFAGADPRIFPLMKGRAQEAAGSGTQAISEYRAFLDAQPALPLDAIFLFDTLERLGRLHEARGDSAEAAGYYRRAADLWKEADSELQPRVRRLRERAAELAPTGR